jgi:hypothetical protein
MLIKTNMWGKGRGCTQKKGYILRCQLHTTAAYDHGHEVPIYIKCKTKMVDNTNTANHHNDNMNQSSGKRQSPEHRNYKESMRV